jgi:hypothetical protein
MAMLANGAMNGKCNGDDHNDGADAEDPVHELKVSRHGNCRIGVIVLFVQNLAVN